jgi:hypothetical protein
MTGLGLSSAGEQRDLTVIPEGTIVEARMKIKPGTLGEGGFLKRSQSGLSQHLDCEFDVTSEGEYHGRKFFATFTMVAEEDTANYATAINIARQTLCAILESGRGISPKDLSEAAAKVRDGATYEDFQGLKFIAQLGVRKGDPNPKGGVFPDKNIIRRVITPDRVEWFQPAQDPRDHPSGMTTSPAAAAVPAPIRRPDWSKNQ